MDTDDERNTFSFRKYIQLEEQTMAVDYIWWNEFTIPKTKETQAGCIESQTNTNGLDWIKGETEPLAKPNTLSNKKQTNKLMKR